VSPLVLELLAFLSPAFLCFSLALFLVALTARGKLDPRHVRAALVAPFARLGPYAAFMALLLWLLSTITQFEEAAGRLASIFVVVTAPALLLASVVSAFIALIGLFERYGMRAWPALGAFAPPAAISIYITLAGVAHTADYMPGEYVALFSLFAILFCISGSISATR